MVHATRLLRLAARLSVSLSILAFLGCAGTTTSRTTYDAADAVDLLPGLVASGDSAGIASLASTRCGKRPNRSQCYEKLLVPVAESGAVRLAMGTLNRLAAADADLRRDGHVYAHAIGIAAGNSGRSVAEIFSQCTETFQSGCYHGVIQAYFSSSDTIGAAEANALCEPFRATEADRWIRFQCVHGMGHGLTMLYAHDLPKGLAGCDLLREQWDRHACYGGAFMENVVNATMPHHPAKSLSSTARGTAGLHDHGAAGAPSHSTHTSGGATGKPSTAKFKALDPADPLYPCSAMEDRYLVACYEMQTSVMLYHNRGDIAGAAQTCDRAPKGMRSVCYKSLGRDISSYSGQDHAKAIRLCSLGAEQYQRWCFFGLVKNLIDLNARASDGMQFCRKVPPGPSKVVCYAAVGEQIAVLNSETRNRTASCDTAEPEFVDVCLYGARVAREVPASLNAILRPPQR